MIEIDMGIAGGVDEFAWLEAADLRNHHCQQRIGGNVERHAEEGVRAALVELTGKLAVGHVELEQAVTWRKGHLVHLAGIPGGDEHPAGVRIVPYLVDDLAELVDAPSVRSRPAAPLVAVNRAKVAVFVSPLVPDCDPVVLEIPYVGISGNEPQELVNY